MRRTGGSRPPFEAREEVPVSDVENAGGLTPTRYAPMATGARGRPWWPAVVVAAVPPFAVLISALLAVRNDPILGRDDAVTEIHVRLALEGEALLGPYSRFGWSHPGPTWFYVAGPVYALFGRGVGGLAVAAALLVAVCVALAVWIVGRCEGWRGAWLASVTLLGWMVSVGTTWFDNYWNPIVAIAPCLVVGVSAAGVASDRGWCLPLLVGFGSFAVQTHINSAPAVIGLTTPALIHVVVGGGWRRLSGRCVGLATGVFGLLWLLPVWEQVTGSPGNLTRLWRFASGPTGDHDPRDVVHQLGPQLTLLRLDVVERSIGRGFGPVNPWWLLVLAGYILVLGAAAYLNHRRARPFVAALSGGSAVASVLLVASAVRTEGRVYAYLSLSAVAVGATAWCALVMTVEREAAWRWTRATRRRIATHLVAVAITLSIVVAWYGVLPAQRGRLRALQPVPTPVVEAIQLLRESIGDASTVWVRIDVAEGWPTAALVANQVEKFGRHFVVDDAWTFMFGEPHRRHDCPPVLLHVGASPTSNATVAFTIAGWPVWLEPTSPTACEADPPS